MFAVPGAAGVLRGVGVLGEAGVEGPLLGGLKVTAWGLFAARCPFAVKGLAGDALFTPSSNVLARLNEFVASMSSLAWVSAEVSVWAGGAGAVPSARSQAWRVRHRSSMVLWRSGMALPAMRLRAAGSST